MNKILKVSKKISESQEKIIRGAGILFICTEDGTAFLCFRSKYVHQPNTWGVPGGALEQEETFKSAAIRETIEEMGSIPKNKTLVDILVNKKEKYIFKLYIINIPQNEKESWTNKIKLNHEHIKFKWFPIGELPNNLHVSIQNLIGL